VAVLLLVNSLVFPEFSSSFLGITTIETLSETVGALRDAGKYFVSIIDDGVEKTEKDAISSMLEGENDPPTAAEEREEKPSELSHFQKIVAHLKKKKNGDTPKKAEDTPKKIQLKSLTDEKARLRAKLAGCKAAQTECNFELAWAVLPPRDLKPISDTHMKKLVANTIALIGACESKYALMGDESDKSEPDSNDEHRLRGVADTADIELGDGSSRPANGNDSSQDDSVDEGTKPERKSKKKRDLKRTSLEREMKDLELVKPKKEIEYGDVELLKYLVARIAKPLADLQHKIDEGVDVVASCLAYCYDVPKLPSGVRAPSGIQLEEIDIRVDILTTALAEFDKDSASALETAAVMHDLDHPQVDIMPRMETFLISSFLLNLRQAALHTLDMLKHSRIMVEKRQARHGRRRLYAPKIEWSKWLSTGGEEDSFALPENARQDIRTGKRKDDPNDNDDESITSRATLVNKSDVESGTGHRTASEPVIPAVRANSATSQKEAELDKGTLVHRIRNGLADIIE
jgi:hypothetical protein